MASGLCERSGPAEGCGGRGQRRRSGGTGSGAAAPERGLCEPRDERARRGGSLSGMKQRLFFQGSPSNYALMPRLLKLSVDVGESSKGHEQFNRASAAFSAIGSTTRLWQNQPVAL